MILRCNGQWKEGGSLIKGMKYKALMLDVDGTLIQNKKDGLPSVRVIRAIQKAQEKIHVGLATSRPLFLLPEILQKVPLFGPSVLNGGAEIIDLSTHTILLEHIISESDLAFLLEKLTSSGLPVWLDDGKSEERYTNAERDYSNIKKVLVHSVSEKIVDELIRETSHVSSFAHHKTPSWDIGNFSIFFTNAQATKQHGIWEVARMLEIETQEIIGVGDGHNDFPLLMACGLKVAMGNAVEDLKAIADYVAPGVEEDGVAEVIERFIL